MKLLVLFILISAIAYLFWQCIKSLLNWCYFDKRNHEVYKFRSEILNIIETSEKKLLRNGHTDTEYLHELYGKYTYCEMLYSFKPLKLESWYAEYEIRRMKGEDLKDDNYEK